MPVSRVNNSVFSDFLDNARDDEERTAWHGLVYNIV